MPDPTPPRRSPPAAKPAAAKPPTPAPPAEAPRPKIDPMEAALLALVADDRTASKVLAVWIAMVAPGLADADLVRRCVDLGVGSPLESSRAVARLRCARLITATGTTDVGMRWLAGVSASLTRRK